MARPRALAAAMLLTASLLPAAGAGAIAAGSAAASTAPVASAVPTGPPKISVRSASVVEGASTRRYVRFAVVMSWRSSQTVTVQYATADGSATGGSDYRPKSGALTFLPGQFVKYVGVTIWPDLREESDETFGFSLAAPTNATLGPASAVGTIHDDEPHVGARVGVGNGAITEVCDRDVGVPLVVTLEGPAPTSAVRVRTVTGTAVSGSDFRAVDKTISIASGVVAKEVRIPVLADPAVEGTEQFTVEVSVVSGPLSVMRGTATVTIADCPD